MNGPIAQVVAITSYGNAWLFCNSEPFFSIENSTAKFCNEICFIDWVKSGWLDKRFRGRKEYYGKAIASDFNSWINYLKRENVKRLYLHYVSSNNPKIIDRMTAGFVGGGGRWLIEAYKGNSSDFWEAKWEVKKKNEGDNRIWRVTYARISRNSTVMINQHIGIHRIKDELIKSIVDCRDFACKHELTGFQTCFENAKSCIEAEKYDYNNIYHKDIIPIGNYSEESKRILFACQPAWVFGGMGSWNDMSFTHEEQKLYETISDRLFNALCNSIPCATNDM